MIRQEIQDYIKQQLAQGTNKEIITSSLTGAGWQKTDIEDSFNSININSSSSAQPLTSASSSNAITENNYPVEFKWVFKSSMLLLILLLFLIPLSIFSHYWDIRVIYIILYTPIHLIFIMLRRNNFHYVIDDKFMVLRQGILSKQQRNIPYGVIQNVFVKQDLFDRVFGLASLSIENASQGAGSQNAGRSKIFGITLSNQKKQTEMVGFSGNKISIPGLTKQNAETLKGIVLQKMKENPIEDSQSGL